MSKLSKTVDKIKSGVGRLYTHDRAFIIILLFAVLIRCYEITLPYMKPYEGALQEVIARNHLIYGFAQTNFVSVVSVVNGQNIYHLSHPPLFQIFIATSYSVFGLHEWSARLVPILFSLGSIVLIYLIARMLWDKETALLSSIFAAFMPISAYFGRIVNFESAALFFALLIIIGYIHWIETNEKKYFFLMLIGVVFGGLTDWPLYLILPFLLGHSLLTKKNTKSMVLIFSIGCSIAILYFVLKSYLIGYEAGVNDWFFVRVWTLRCNPSMFLLNYEFYMTVFQRLLDWFTVMPLVLFLYGMYRSLRVIMRKKSLKDNIKNSEKHLIPLIILMFGLSWILLFPRSTYVHDRQIFYLIPGVSIYAAIGLSQFLHKKSNNRLINVGAVVLLVLIMSAFLFSSTNFVLSMHSWKTSEYKDIGVFIKENTNPDDLILVSQEAYAILYYSERNDIQSPLDALHRDPIKRGQPKFVVYPKYAFSMDMTWNISEWDNLLLQNNYIKIPTKIPFTLWARDVGMHHFLLSEKPTIELRYYNKAIDIIETKKHNLVHPAIQGEGKTSFYVPPINGKIFVNFNVTIPINSSLAFSIGLDERNWSPDKGDGVLFEIYINDTKGDYIIFSKYIDPKNNVSDRKWHDFEILLNNYAGKNVTLSFVTSPGPKNNCAYDWAYWGEPRIIVMS